MNYCLSSLVFVPSNSLNFQWNYNGYQPYPVMMDFQQHYPQSGMLTNFCIPTAFATIPQQHLGKMREQMWSGAQMLSTKEVVGKLQKNKTQGLKNVNKKFSQQSIEEETDNSKLYTKKKYVQNPRRNVITNLGNQLLSSLTNRFKLNEILRKFPQKPDEELLSHMLIYINQVKKSLNSYLNAKKMRDIWYPEDISYHLEEILELFRRVSYYYLTSHVHIQVIKSQKTKEETKLHHLKGIKTLIHVLRNPPRNHNSIKEQS